MPLSANFYGYSTQNGVEADAVGNMQVNLPQNLTNPGFVNLAGQVVGTTGLSQNRAIPVSSEGRPHVALDRPIFYHNFAGSATAANAISTDAFKQTATTMTMSGGSTAGGFLWLNSGLSVAATVGIAYQTYGTFPTFGGYETRYEFEAMSINCNTAVNKVLELGAGLITDAKTAGLLDGFCFRWTAAGTFIGVISINGSEYQTSPLNVPTDNILHRFSIIVTQLGCEFYVDQILQATLAIPTGAAGPGYNTNPPLLIRIYNTASTPALAPQVKISEVWISQLAMDWQKPWSHICSSMGQHAGNVPYGQAMVANGTGTTNQSGGATAGGAAVPAAATGTNTAILTGCATLGGVATMTAQATNTAAAGNMIFFSYPVPAQSATQASKRLVITGVSISCSNGGAAVATTPTTLLWSIYWGNTAVSLATTDAVNTKGPRFMALGQMTVAVGAAVGAMYDRDIVRTFSTPIVVNPGEYVGVAARFLIGTATSSQTVVAAVAFEGYWE